MPAPPPPSPEQLESLRQKIRANLSPDLLAPAWRNLVHSQPGAAHSTGHCYVTSEAAYNLLGGKAAGWTPMHVRVDGSPHWYLQHESGQRFDATDDQFHNPVPYEAARGKGFLTAEPSRRARVLIQRVRLQKALRDCTSKMS